MHGRMNSILKSICCRIIIFIYSNNIILFMKDVSVLVKGKNTIKKTSNEYTCPLNRRIFSNKELHDEFCQLCDDRTDCGIHTDDTKEDDNINDDIGHDF